LPAAISASIYRIVQEALTNAAKHAGATRVGLELAMGAGEIELAIDDDGRSTDPTAKSGMGLLGMRERVAALRGRLSFEAGPHGGSSLRVVIPLAAGDWQVME